MHVCCVCIDFARSASALACFPGVCAAHWRVSWRTPSRGQTSWFPLVVCTSCAAAACGICPFVVHRARRTPLGMRCGLVCVPFANAMWCGNCMWAGCVFACVGAMWRRIRRKRRSTHPTI